MVRRLIRYVETHKDSANSHHDWTLHPCSVIGGKPSKITLGVRYSDSGDTVIPVLPEVVTVTENCALSLVVEKTNFSGFTVTETSAGLATCMEYVELGGPTFVTVRVTTAVSMLAELKNTMNEG